MAPIISIENLSKRYLVGHQSGERERYTALRDVVGRSVKNFLRDGRNMLLGKQIVQGDEVEDFWALRDVSFDIEPGDVVGIIGRNGAGKSTLLKILSRITEPSAGRVTLRGRVASLLEVGTGFHPELTGRENIFLNGAILGMSRAEIKRKFDEIVDFAEVEKFLDTPVKRYSSGMYVRLAFSVAAHLEPEILIVDEVLAVGDASFQKKCLGKMQSVSASGRTVLLVSHQMGTIVKLCSKVILLESGCLASYGESDSVVRRYFENGSNCEAVWRRSPTDAKNKTTVQAITLLRGDEPTTEVAHNESIRVAFSIASIDRYTTEKLCITIQDQFQNYISTVIKNLSDFPNDDGIIECKLQLPGSFLVPNSYSLRVAIFVGHSTPIDIIDSACPFRVIDAGSDMASYEGINYGYVHLPFRWEF